VGEKKSSHAITEEYAKADPIYVAKTAVSISADFNSVHTHRYIGFTTKVLALSSDTWRWELWMAG
jgi:hypothetical protein